MSQSCETLVTKINEWWQEILALKNLSEKFLDMGDKNIKKEIEDKKKEIINCEKEYQMLAYPEFLDNGCLFWPEKEALEELFQESGENLEYFVNNGFVKKNNPQDQNTHISTIYLGGRENSDLSKLSLKINLSLFKHLTQFFSLGSDLRIFPILPKSLREISIDNNPNIKIPNDLSNLIRLEEFSAQHCKLKVLPKFSSSMKSIEVTGNPNIQISKSLRHLDNLEMFSVNQCNLMVIPELPTSIKYIDIHDNPIKKEERQRIKRQHPNAEIFF